MPVVLAVLVYAGRVLSRLMGARLKQRQAGPFLVLAVAVVVPALWVQFRPSGLATLSFWGELAGVWLVYLLSCLLVLGTGPGGWSRGSAAWTACTCRTQWTAVVATVTLAPHLLTGIGATLSYASPLGTGPRGGCGARPAHPGSGLAPTRGEVPAPVVSAVAVPLPVDPGCSCWSP